MIGDAVTKKPSNKTYRVAVLPGTGIGREVIEEAMRVADWFVDRRGLQLKVEYPPWGPDAYRQFGKINPDSTMEVLRDSDAILFGATGGPEMDGIPRKDFELGSLRQLRRDLGLFANLRPIYARWPTLDASTLKAEVVTGVDMVVVRELTGGIYFGEPRGIERLPDGRQRGINTQVYTSDEVERIARVAFDLARQRKGRVCSVDKANVMESGKMWREEVERLHADAYQDVELSHMYVDNAAMQLVRNPGQFDVMLTDNLFGDILSDCAAMITGSLGMLPSASFSTASAADRGVSFYEPVHGSAPDIAGKNIANPLGAILSLGMALRYSLEAVSESDLLENAVTKALSRCRTVDLAQPGFETVSTTDMGQAVVDALERLIDDR